MCDVTGATDDLDCCLQATGESDSDSNLDFYGKLSTLDVALFRLGHMTDPSDRVAMTSEEEASTSLACSV